MSPADAASRFGVEAGLTSGEPSPYDDPRLIAAIEEYASLLDRGVTPHLRRDFLGRHAAIAGPLGECLDGMDFVQGGAGAFRGDAAPAAGEVLGDFVLGRVIGRGGMGVVYEAEQKSLGRKVALKVLPLAASMDPRQLQRFRLEAQAAALLHHEHIVPVFGTGSDRGIHYFAMQLIEGRPLTAIIRELGGEGPLASASPSATASTVRSRARDAARLGVQAADALEHAHGIGVIHRDIKPANLLVDGRGELWITDFGLARLLREDLDITLPGDLIGTLRYMSPEQVRGERGNVAAASDVYSLGATLYEYLALRPAFDGADRAGLVPRILRDDPTPPRRIDPSIPRDLETIVLKALEKDPAARYPTAAALSSDLRRFLDDQPVLARRPGPIDRTVKWCRRHRQAVFSGVAALILTLLTASGVLWEANRRTSATVDELKRALMDQRLALEYSLGAFDQITQPLAVVVGSADPDRSKEARRVLGAALSFYERVYERPSDAPMLREIYPKARRQAGSCRTALGSPKARDDYRLAIDLYERAVRDFPRQVWLRTALIETLVEYSRTLTHPADADEAASTLGRALATAEATLRDPVSSYPCFRPALGPAYHELARLAVSRPGLSQPDARLSARLARKALEWDAGREEYEATLKAVLARIDPSVE